jgi:hypothetical protein
LAEKELSKGGSGRRKIGKTDYQAQGVLFILEKARFAYLLNLPEGDRMYTFLLLKENDKTAYEALVSFGTRYTTAWDEPVLTKAIRESPARHQNRGHYRSRAEEHEGCGKGTLGDEEDGGCSRAIPAHVIGQQDDARRIHLIMKGRV